jgi:hypothetical protein
VRVFHLEVFSLRKSLCILAVLLAVTLPTFAQKATVFAGYSYINVDVSETKGLQTPGSITNRVSLNGWNAQGAYLLSPHFALAADFGGYYGTPKISGLDFKTKAHTFLFGPAVLTKKGKFMPSAHILFGGSTMSATEKSSSTDVVNGTHFSWAGGGALDYVASKRIAIRLAQLDYVGTKMSLTKNIQTSTGLGAATDWQNNVRYSGGLVFIF